MSGGEFDMLLKNRNPINESLILMFVIVEFLFPDRSKLVSNTQ